MVLSRRVVFIFLSSGSAAISQNFERSAGEAISVFEDNCGRNICSHPVGASTTKYVGLVRYTNLKIASGNLSLGLFGSVSSTANFAMEHDFGNPFAPKLCPHIVNIASASRQV